MKTDDTNLEKLDKGSKTEYVTQKAGDYQSNTGSKISTKTKTKTHRLDTGTGEAKKRNRENTQKLGLNNGIKNINGLRLNCNTHDNLKNNIQEPDIISLSPPFKKYKSRQKLTEVMPSYRKKQKTKLTLRQ